jgi:drug/metabolite transporter (DMT)-like permease
MGVAHGLLRRLGASLPPPSETYAFVLAGLLSPLSYLFLTASVTGTMMYLVALRSVPLSRAAVVFLTTTTVTVMVLDTVFYGTRPSALTLAGAALCIVGIAIVSSQQ